MDDDETVRTPPKPKPDRRRRHADDPSVPVSVYLPLALKERLDAAVVARRATRNALISQALAHWLDQQERAAPPDDAEKPSR